VAAPVDNERKSLRDTGMALLRLRPDFVEPDNFFCKKKSVCISIKTHKGCISRADARGAGVTQLEKKHMTAYQITTFF